MQLLRLSGMFSKQGKRARRAVACLCLGVAIALTSTSAFAYFRYVDENGKLVLSQTIPNERVKFGYEVVDQHGRLIERVEPQLTSAQYEERLVRERRQGECERTLTRTRKLYQTQEDIDYAEQQAMESLETRLANTHANLAVVQNQRKDFESTAAQYDVAGKKIPGVLLDNIGRATIQEQTLSREIELRDQERVTLSDEYAYDRVVFDLDEEQCANGLPARTDGSLSVSANSD